jgi:putative CocE/NonD family hydrolase
MSEQEKINTKNNTKSHTSDTNEMIEKFVEHVRKQFNDSSYPVEYEDFECYEEMLPLRDGVRLRTIYYFPKTDQRESFPTIVQRSCYPDMDRMMRVNAEELAKRGFGFVYQYCRGVGGSEGVWRPNDNDRNDGQDFMNYLNSLEKVECMGYQGASYLAFTGWVMADILPDKVKSLYLTVYGTDRHTSAYKDGLFRHDILTAWAMGNAGREISADLMESCKYRPHIEVDKALWGGELDWYRNWITNTSRTDPYWNEGFWHMLSQIPKRMNLPVYIGEGWYDHHLGSAIKSYINLSDESKAHSVLEIGPWNHSGMPCITGHTHKNAEGSTTLKTLDWFTKTLKKKELPEPKIRCYVIGADEWREWSSYPFKPDHEEYFYLSDKLIADGAYSLEASPAASGQISYLYDPNDPVISHGSESLFATQSGIGSLKQPQYGFRDDVISFVSEPFNEEKDIIGIIKAKIFVSTDAEDTAFTMKVMEVFPYGSAYNIRNGITTLAYRNGSPERISYTPNSIEEITIDSWDIAWRMQKGSRLRIDISSSNFPEYAVHSNYPGVWSKQDKTKTAKQTIYVGQDHPSCVILPIE